MFKKRLITISALPFVTALLLGSSLIISNKPEKVSAINETHEHDDWTGVSELPSEAGDYYLTDNITLSATWTVPEGTTNLCLNGHNIKITVPDDYVITITEGATLNLYDCDTHYQFFEADEDGLWSLKAEQDVPTDYAINGGCIMGATVGGVYCSGTFNMYGGNIVGNKAAVGGGVNNTGTFNMYDGNISGNLATESGGGVYTASNAVSILTGGTITQNTAPNGAGVYYKTGACFVAGTQITMADGSKKAIEELAVGDSVRVFDHNNGNISSSKLFDVGAMFEQQSGVVNLHFTSDIDLSVVYGHSFFDREANKYVSVTKDTVSNYVGHQFYNADNACWETLTGYNFVDGEVDTYIIASEYNLNCFANGMLSVEDGFYTALSNTFEFGDNLTIDAIKKAQDIEKYGIYDFENINYVNKHTYDALGLQNLNVTVGKGLFSKDYFEYLAMILSEVDPEIYCDIAESEPVSKSMPLRTRTETPVSAPAAAGLYVGGSIQIIGNKEENLYLPTDAMITIGTGTVGTGNGVPTPTEAMSIGLTLQNGIGAFTASGVEDYSANFFSDNENYAVRLNKGTEETPGDYLALKTLLTITNNNSKTSKDTYNGYIELSGFAVAGDEISVTVFPNQGYKLVSLQYNDGEKDHDIEDLSFVMPEGDVSVSATFEEKGEQVIEIGDISKIYDGLPINFDQYSSALSYLGDGEVTIEFKVADASDETYTTDRPVNAGEYTVRVTVAESSTHFAGVKTKDFTISYAKINKVGFDDISQPVAGETAPDSVKGIAIGSRYTGSISWSPSLVDGKFDCKTTYTVTITLDIVPSSIENYVFAEDVVLVKPNSEGWAKSTDSTQSKLVFTKEFEPTADHSVNKINGTNATCTEDGFKDAYQCETCGLYYEDEACSELIGDETAYNAWIFGDGKISASGHSMTHHEAVAPTCTQDGNVEYWECSHESGIYYADEQGTSTLPSVAVSKLGHDIVHHDAKAPTCTEVGWEAYDTCSRCDYSTYVEIPALGHSLSEVAGKSATCTEDGYMVAYKCSTCEIYFTDPAGEHEIGDETAYNTWKLNEGKLSARHIVNMVPGVDPTKERSGYKEAWKCSECGQYFEDEACTVLIGDEAAYNIWKANKGYLPQLPNEGLSGGAIAGICVGSIFLLLLVIYLIGYFFLYRKGKLDEKKIKVIYKFLSRGVKNLKQDDK